MYAEDCSFEVEKIILVEKVGKYEYLENENLKKFYEVVGVPFMPKTVLLSTKPTLEIKYDHIQWTFKIHSEVFATEFTFKIGEEFNQMWPTMVSSTNLAKIKHNTLIFKSDGNYGLVINEFQFMLNRLILTQKHKPTGTVARQIFMRM